MAIAKYWTVLGVCAFGFTSAGCFAPLTAGTQSRHAPPRTVTPQQEIEDRIGALRDAVRADPHDIPARLSLAIALQDQGELEAAATELQRVVRMAPSNALAHNLLGDVYLDQGRKAAQSEAAWVQERLEAAAEQFTTSVRLTPAANLLLAAFLGLGATYEDLSKLYLQQQDPQKAASVREKARVAFGEAFKICPDCEKSLTRLAIEKAWVRGGLPSAYGNFHLISFEQRIKRVQDEILKIRSQAAQGQRLFEETPPAPVADDR